MDIKIGQIYRIRDDGCVCGEIIVVNGPYYHMGRDRWMTDCHPNGDYAALEWGFNLRDTDHYVLVQPDLGAAEID